MTPKDENTRFIKRLMADIAAKRQSLLTSVGSTLFAVALIVFILQTNPGPEIALYLGAVLFGLLGLFAVVLFRRAHSKVWRALKGETADALLATFGSMGKQDIPAVQLSYRYCRALTYALYGQFSSAREELASISREDAPPMLFAARLEVETLLEIFETQDYARARVLAIQAQSLAEQSPFTPGAKRAKLSFQALVAATNALAGQNPGVAILELTGIEKKLPPLSRVTALWALAKAYHLLREPEAAERWEREYRRVSPHTVPVLS